MLKVVRRVRLCIPYVVLSLALCTPLFAAEGTIRGTVTDPAGAVVPHAMITLRNQSAGSDRITTADGEGRFQFQQVPYGQVTLTAEAHGFRQAARTADLRSPVPLILDFKMEIAESRESLTITEQPPLLEIYSNSSHQEFDDEEIERQPQASPQTAMSALLESVPGVVPEENGRIHIRGSEAPVQYILDGVPVLDNLMGTFNTALDEDDVHSSDVVTGNLPAEFAGRTSAVVTVDTKSGLESPLRGALSLYGGSFDSAGADLDLGGNLRKRLGFYVSSQGNITRRYLDPPEIVSFHNDGRAAHIFTRIDWLPSQADSLHLNLAVNGTNFQVANTELQQSAGQHQRQERRDDSQSLRWTHLFNESTLGEVLAFRRASTGRLLDPLVTGFPYFTFQHRRSETEGLHLSLSHERGRHSWKLGAQVHRIGLHENFLLAATDPAILNDPENPASLFPVSDPFTFGGRRNGYEAGVFVQDRIRVRNWTLDLGLRLDCYKLLVHNSAASPRVGVAYYLQRTGTVFRASYNRIFQTPNIENLLLSSATEAGVFAGGARVERVPPDWQNVYEIGIQQQLGRYLRLDLGRYIRNARNFSDDESFLDTGVVFPISVARGDARGTEARLNLRSVRGVSAYLSYANSKVTNTTPITGGLPIGEGPQIGANGKFPGDQDERNEGQVGVTYIHRSGLWGTFTGRYDSGVPADVEPDDATDGTLDPRIVKALDFTRKRIKPRARFGMAAGYDFMRESSHPVSLQFSVNNLTNRFYLYNFRSIFSGTHVGRPREFVGQITFHFQANK